jgi:hypothetical protein
MHIITIPYVSPCHCLALRACALHACEFFPILPHIFLTICQGVGCNALELWDVWMVSACFLSVILLIALCSQFLVLTNKSDYWRRAAKIIVFLEQFLTIFCHSAEVTYVTRAWHIWHCIFLIMHKLLTVPTLCIMSICTVLVYLELLYRRPQYAPSRSALTFGYHIVVVCRVLVAHAVEYSNRHEGRTVQQLRSGCSLPATSWRASAAVGVSLESPLSSRP